MKSKYSLPQDGGLIIEGTPKDIIHRYEKIPTSIFESEGDGVNYVADMIVEAIREHEENGGKRFLAAVPSEKLCVSYVIDYSGTPVGTQNVTYDVTRETFYNIISRARTFGLTSELEYLRRNGLAKGGSLDNALVFDGEGLVGDASLRFPLECVTHKVIDLLGDLTLAGPIPTAHYVAIAAGHSIHGKLARRIRTVFPL